MSQFMSVPVPYDGPKFSREVSEIERFRARHRRLCRGQQDALPGSRIEALDVDGGRTCKISANWRQNQQQTQLRNQLDDGYWPESAGTEMHLGYNAFDSSAPPEGFCDDAEDPVVLKAPVIEPNQQLQPEPAVELEPASDDDDDHQKRKQFMADVGKKVASMGFNNTSMWERRLPGRQLSGKPIQQLSTFGQNVLWGFPVHYASYNDQRQAMYYQPQYYV
ncbi:hypothetical protein PI124_g1342 [Phytophthora idaei]|nr:hypothetical protein PI125_g3000 [Phytophthora idaei]KAG3165330.1 hypothetical protein PI126_g4717 [Phytophthora idaei]KAG3254087.1 hypothetical protein PI124_g1342 [Phytophthora idaei]